MVLFLIIVQHFYFIIQEQDMKEVDFNTKRMDIALFKNHTKYIMVFISVSVLG